MEQRALMHLLHHHLNRPIHPKVHQVNHVQVQMYQLNNSQRQL
jgi:hypothetical protein